MSGINGRKLVATSQHQAGYSRYMVVFCDATWFSHFGSSVISSLARLCLQVTLPTSGPLQEGRIQQLLTYHSGSIVGLAASPYSHMAITAGADGTVRLYDYR